MTLRDDTVTHLTLQEGIMTVAYDGSLFRYSDLWSIMDSGGSAGDDSVSRMCWSY